MRMTLVDFSHPMLCTQYRDDQFEYYSFDDSCTDLVAETVVVNIYIQKECKSICIFLYVTSTLNNFKYDFTYTITFEYKYLVWQENS